MDWASVFDELHPEPGATEAEIQRFTETIGQPLTTAEIDEIVQSQSNPFPPTDPLHSKYKPFDPSVWVMPSRPLPESYLSFLRFSNGGLFINGEREFGFFPTMDPTGGLREMLLAYHVPEYMPGALPIAFNGGGTFYMFDLRNPAIHGEYPVVAVGSGYLSWKPEACVVVATNFLEACRGRINVDDLR